MKRNQESRKKFSVNRGSRENVMEKQPKKRKSTAIKRRIKTISMSEPSTSDEYSPVENKLAKLKMSYTSQLPTVVNGNTSLTTIHLNNQTKVIAQNFSSPEKQRHQYLQNYQSYQQLEQQPYQVSLQETTMQYQQQSPIAPQIHNQLNCNLTNINNNQRPPRTSEDFYLFCQFILEHENYNDMTHQEELRKTTPSPMDSTGSTTESTTSSVAPEEQKEDKDFIKINEEVEINQDNEINSTVEVNQNVTGDNASTNEEDSVTCYCGKPYAARPMIECSSCLTWLHFSCAKVNKKHIPDIFLCSKCTKKKLDTNAVKEEDDAKSNDTNTIQIHNGNDDKPLKSLQPLENESEKAAIVTSDNTVSSTVDSDTGNLHSTTPNKTNSHLDKYRSNRKTIVEEVA